jgi:hypothetical protein
VIDGENGYHVTDEQAMAEATGRLDAIDPARCRESVASRYDVAMVADGYEAVYDRAIRAAASRTSRFARHGQPPSQWTATADCVPRRAARASTLQPAG